MVVQRPGDTKIEIGQRQMESRGQVQKQVQRQGAKQTKI